jgi:hypothetical protein
MERFSYEEIEARPSYADKRTSIWRPVIPFSVRGLSGRFDGKALVDTGASESLFPMDIWDEVEPAHVVGETGALEAANGTRIEVIYGTVDLGIKLGRKRFWWSAVVGFTKDRKEAVLGDAGFMRYFSVTFNRPERILTIREPLRLPKAIMPPT